MLENTVCRLDPTVLAYMAGFVDGEGTITIHRTCRGERYRDYENYAVAVKVCQGTQAICAWFKETLGFGHVATRHTTSKVSGELKKYTVYTWETNHRNAYFFVSAILPYLRVKKEQGELAVGFSELKQAFNETRIYNRQKGIRGTAKTPPELLEKYRDYRERMQRLNYGKGDPKSRVWNQHIDAIDEMREAGIRLPV